RGEPRGRVRADHRLRGGSRRMNAAWIVFLKEIRENLRDRRTLLNTLVTGPLMAPILFVLVINVALQREFEKADAPLEVPVVGAEHAPNLVAGLEHQGLRVVPAPADPEQAVREQEAELVLRIPAGFAEAWRRGETAQVELIYDASRRDSGSPVQRLSG